MVELLKREAGLAQEKLGEISMLGLMINQHNKSSITSLTRCMALCLLLPMAGWSTAADKQFSGFLGPDENYARLQEAELKSGEKEMRWLSPKLNLANYKRVLLEPVGFYPEPEPNERVTAETLQQLQAHLDMRLREQVGEVLTLADSPASEVARIEAAVTGVAIKTQGMKAYEVVPMAAVMGGVKAASGKRKQDVSVFVEVRITDSENGELLGMVVRTVAGKPLKNKKTELKFSDIEADLDTAASDASEAIADSIRE